jgi:hypothetical protein
MTTEDELTQDEVYNILKEANSEYELGYSREQLKDAAENYFDVVGSAGANPEAEEIKADLEAIQNPQNLGASMRIKAVEHLLERE